MAKSRRDRQGIMRYQITLWIHQNAWRRLKLKTTLARKRSGVVAVTESAVAASLLESVLSTQTL